MSNNIKPRTSSTFPRLRFFADFGLNLSVLVFLLFLWRALRMDAMGGARPTATEAPYTEEAGSRDFETCSGIEPQDFVTSVIVVSWVTASFCLAP